MDPLVFSKAVGVGIAIAAPVGPMSLLCMRCTLLEGWRFGAATGFGIASGDAIYASVAALGLVGISRFMLAHNAPLHAAAGLCLLYLGARALRRGPASSVETRPVRSLTAACASAVLLTLTNPPTILSFAAIFTVLAPRTGFDLATAIATVAGVLAGSMLWWTLLAFVITALRDSLGVQSRQWLNRVSAAILGIFGIVELKRSL